MAKIAIPLASGFEDSEFTVPYERLREAGHEVTVFGPQAGETVMGKRGKARQRVETGAASLAPDEFDALVIPGGHSTRSKTPVIYANDEGFTVGGSKTLRRSAQDAVTLVTAGITVHEALIAHDTLRKNGIASRVIDAYSVKPLDVASLRQAAQETGLLLVVEDHVGEGGLGEAVAGAVGALAPVHRLAVRAHPRSGSQAELLLRLGIDHQAIEQYVRGLIGPRGDARAAS